MSAALQKLEELLTQSHFEEEARSELMGLPVRTFTSPSTVVIGFEIPEGIGVNGIDRAYCHLQEAKMVPALTKGEFSHCDGVLCLFRQRPTDDEDDPRIQEKMWDLERDFTVCIKNVIYTDSQGNWEEEDCILSPLLSSATTGPANSIWLGSDPSVELSGVEIPIENVNVLVYYEDSSVPLPVYQELQRKLHIGSGKDYHSSCIDVILEDKKRVEWMFRFREYLIANPESKFLVPIRSRNNLRHLMEKLRGVDVSIGKVLVKRGVTQPRISYEG